MPKRRIKLSRYMATQNLPRIGESFGSLKATGRFKTSRRGYKLYEVCCPHGIYKFKKASELRYGTTKYCRLWKNCPAFGLSQTAPEFITIKSHYYVIFKSKQRKDSCYKKMPFYSGWNPDKGGSFYEGYKWVIENLGKRPKGASLHIVNHEIGFMPGNLEWAHPRKQCNQQMYKIIAQLKHKIKLLEAKLRRK